MPRQKIEPRKCPHCRNKGQLIRGVCPACYVTGRNRIKRGEVTDKQLVTAKFWKPAGKRGGQGERSKKIDQLLASAAK